MNQKDFKI